MAERSARRAAKRGSVYIGEGRWVSIPVGSPRRPLTDAELDEARRILAKAQFSRITEGRRDA